MKNQWMVRALSKTLTLTSSSSSFTRSLCSSTTPTPTFAIKNVTKSNFESTLSDLRRIVRDADFVSVDLEMTGVTSAPWRESFEFDRFDIRYLKVKDSAEKFAVVQFGVCPFRWDSSKQSFVAYPLQKIRLLNLSRPLSHITRVRNYWSALPDCERTKLFAEFKNGITVLVSEGDIGTRFVVDKKKGHVITAAHNVMDVTDAEELVDVLKMTKALKLSREVLLTPYGIERPSKTIVAAIALVYDLALLKMDPRLLANAINFQFGKEDLPVGSSVFP